MVFVCGYKQDLPPKGGYSPYQIDRTPLRTIFGGRKALYLGLGSVIVGHIWFWLGWKKLKKFEYEMRGSTFALLPLLMAERDRILLKQLKLNFEEEKKLMRFYPSWKPGTFFGEKIYKTIPENEYVEPSLGELLAHVDKSEYYKQMALIQFA